MLHNKTNAELLKEFDKHVIGHTEAKKVLISLVNRSKLAHYNKYLAEMYGDISRDIPTVNAMLIGGSGTGKTFLIKTLKKIVDFPLVAIDATRLEPVGGAKSDDAKYVLKMIMENAQRLVDEPNNGYYSLEGTIDQTVVFIDEIDKLAKPFESSGNWNKQIQSSLLSLLENNEGFENVSYVLAGAFADLKKESAPRTSIGFVVEEESVVDPIITDDDIIKYGLMPELVGRLSYICRLDLMTHETMNTILETLLVPEKMEQMAALGINADNVLDNELRESIIKIALESGMGVRSLKRELNMIFNDLEFNYEENQLQEPEQLQLTFEEK